MKKTVSFSRREALKAAAASGFALTAGSVAAVAETLAVADNPVIRENKKKGATDWQLTRVRPDRKGFRTPFVEGYCSRRSVRAGEKLDIMVSTDPVRNYRIDFYRTGYYGGAGARLVHSVGPLSGKIQETPVPGNKKIHECSWDVSHTLTIPADWLSGVYLGKLRTLPESTNEPYWESYIIFIVTDDRPADLLFQCSDNSWQAYNRWPDDYSLWTNSDGKYGPNEAVSFDRPYGRQAQHMSIVNDPLSFGAGEFLSFERPLSYFLEEHGYDVTYCSGEDMLTPDRALKARAFMSVGHDEFWDLRQFRSVERIRDEGVSLLFFSGNSVNWVSPHSANSKGVANRTIYRSGPYGGSRPHPEVFEKNWGPFPERGPDEGMLLGVRNIPPVNGGGDWVVVKPDHWMFKGTGMKKGDSIPGLVGWEFTADAADIAGLEIVAEGTAFRGGTFPTGWQSVVYPCPRGNFVFNASTIFWPQALSHPPGHTLPWSHYNRPHGPDPRVQQITHNLLLEAIKKKK